MKERKGSKLIKKYDIYYIEISNTYSLLVELSANLGQPDTPTSTDSQFIIRVAKWLQKKTNDKLKKYLCTNRNNDGEIINAAITLAEDERTVMAKNYITNVHRVTIDAAHTATDRTKTAILQRGRNMGHAISTETQCLLHSIPRDSKHVQFRRKPTIATFYEEDDATMLIYDSGADVRYLSENDREKLRIPILRVSAKKVGVANGGACNGKYVTKLLFP